MKVYYDSDADLNLIKNKIRFKLLIIGHGSMENELKLYVNKNNLENNVKILKNISNPFPYFIKSNLFILSSILFLHTAISFTFFLPTILLNCSDSSRVNPTFTAIFISCSWYAFDIINLLVN